MNAFGAPSVLATNGTVIQWNTILVMSWDVPGMILLVFPHGSACLEMVLLVKPQDSLEDYMPINKQFSARPQSIDNRKSTTVPHYYLRVSSTRSRSMEE